MSLRVEPRALDTARPAAQARATAENERRMRLALDALTADLGKHSRAAKESLAPPEVTAPAAKSARENGKAAPGAGRAPATAAATDGPQPLGELDYLVNPTPAQLGDLARGIRAAMAADSGKSRQDPSVLAPQTLTSLQRGLFKAVNGLPRETLMQHPELLAAVREGFATRGGQQLALVIHMMDAGIVCDLGAPSNSERYNWSSQLKPETTVHMAFDIDPSLPPGVRGAVLDWVRQAQNTPVGRQQLAALVQGPVRIEAGPDTGSLYPSVSATERTLEISAQTAPESMSAALEDMAIGLLGQQAKLTEQHASLVDRAIEFDASVPESVRNIVRAAADNSPTLRNVLHRAIENNGRLAVGVDGTQAPFGGVFDFAGPRPSIFLAPASVNEMAKTALFELSNAAQLPLHVLAQSPTHALATGQTDRYVADIYLGYAKKNPREMQKLREWLKERHGEAAAQAEQGMGALGQQVREYLNERFGADRVKLAAQSAISIELQEFDTMLLHAQIGTELNHALQTGVEGARKAALTAGAVQAIGESARNLEFASMFGNVRRQALAANIRAGHTGQYFFEDGPAALLQQRVAPALHAAIAAETEAAHAALGQAGSSAGSAAQQEIERTSRQTPLHLPAGRAALNEAAHASVEAQSQALAERILADPMVAKVLKGGGHLLTAAAVASMTYDLGQAIYHDVVAGDHEAHASRKVVAELGVGLVGGEVGAAAGAAAGSLAGGALGSVVPVLGTAVGAFIGGLVGGLAGGFFGFRGGVKAGDVLFDKTQKPIDALIEHLIAAAGGPQPPASVAQGPEITLPRASLVPGAGTPQGIAATVTEKSGSADAYLNGEEMKNGLIGAGYTVNYNGEQEKALFAAYFDGVKGTISKANLGKAIEDGALELSAQRNAAIRVLAAVRTKQDIREHRVLGGGPSGGSGFGNDNAASNFAHSVIAHGSRDDGYANMSELENGFKAAGFDLGGAKAHVDLLVQQFGKTIKGTLTAAELASLIRNGTIRLHADHVTVNWVVGPGV